MLLMSLLLLLWQLLLSVQVMGGSVMGSTL